MEMIFKAQRPIEQRIELLKYPLWKVDGSLRDELVAAGPGAVEPLIAALQDSDAHLRRSAAEVLGRLGDPRAVGPLTALCSDSNGAVRGTASVALAKIKV